MAEKPHKASTTLRIMQDLDLWRTLVEKKKIPTPTHDKTSTVFLVVAWYRYSQCNSWTRAARNKASPSAAGRVKNGWQPLQIRGHASFVLNSSLHVLKTCT